MPVAGHIDGTDSPEESLRKELEELGLEDQNDLQENKEMATYSIAIRRLSTV